MLGRCSLVPTGVFSFEIDTIIRLEYTTSNIVLINQIYIRKGCKMDTEECAEKVVITQIPRDKTTYLMRLKLVSWDQGIIRRVSTGCLS